MDSWITPNEVWFVRHHHPVPIVDIKNYVLEIKGEGLRPTTFTLDELKTKFTKRKVRL
jgi:DMSO/TMAO reductase YedYZ molybdopterin-dependent catalytic subunit